MSSAFFIVLDNPNPGFDTFVNGKALAQSAERLAPIAESLGLRQLDDYVSYPPDEARAMIEDMGGDPDEVDIGPEQWFEADEGLTWISRLAKHLEANPTVLKNSKKVLGELEEYAEVLQKAKTVRARWHLQVDF
jgi:hypothetical protein